MRLALVLAAMTAAAACAPRAEVPSATAADPCAQAPTGKISVQDAWLRPAAAGQAASALYFTICNRDDADDALLAVRSAIADSVEIHETTRSQSGVVSMNPIVRLDLPAGAGTSLAPGGRHVMLIGLSAPVEEGARQSFTLVLERSGEILVSATARRATESGGHDH